MEKGNGGGEGEGGGGEGRVKRQKRQKYNSEEVWGVNPNKHPSPRFLAIQILKPSNSASWTVEKERRMEVYDSSCIFQCFTAIRTLRHNKRFELKRSRSIIYGSNFTRSFSVSYL